MKRIYTAIVSLMMVGIVGTAAAAPVSAIDVFGGCSTSDGAAASSVCKSQGDSVTPIFQKIVSLLLYIIGIISILMIVIGGVKYVTSSGDQNSIKSAKDTVQYAIVGLVVAVLGQAIILFVLKWFK